MSRASASAPPQSSPMPWVDNFVGCWTEQGQASLTFVDGGRGRIVVSIRAPRSWPIIRETNRWLFQEGFRPISYATVENEHRGTVEHRFEVIESSGVKLREERTLHLAEGLSSVLEYLDTLSRPTLRPVPRMSY